MTDSVTLIDAPEVYLIGRQEVVAEELDRFLADEGVESWETDTEVAGQKLVEVAGRVCYMSFAKPRPGGNAAYVDHILEVGHGSVLEHAVFNLLFTGVSRSLTHELVRHRAGMGYSQLSQRYVDESSAAFVVPPALADEVAAARAFMAKHGFEAAADASMAIAACYAAPEDDCRDAVKVGLRWLWAVERDLDDYRFLSDHLFEKYADIADRTARRKAAREAARSVLPNATETKIFVTGNTRALRHFIEMRGDPAADAEIRRAALAAHRLLVAEAPAFFGDYGVERDADGREYVAGGHRKV